VHYDERLMVTPWKNRLKAYPVLQWEKVEEQLMAHLQDHPNMVKMIRYKIGGVVECPLDKQGRILLPPKLREEGGISNKEIMITGVMTYFEILNKQTWEAENKFSEAEHESFDEIMLKAGLL